MLMRLWKLMSITVVIALGSTNNSIDEEKAVMANNRALKMQSVNSYALRGV